MGDDEMQRGRSGYRFARWGPFSVRNEYSGRILKIKSIEMGKMRNKIGLWGDGNPSRPGAISWAPGISSIRGAGAI
jgi:hypothetical protein